MDTEEELPEHKVPLQIHTDHLMEDRNSLQIDRQTATEDQDRISSTFPTRTFPHLRPTTDLRARVLTEELHQVEIIILPIKEDLPLRLMDLRAKVFHHPVISTSLAMEDLMAEAVVVPHRTTISMRLGRDLLPRLMDLPAKHQTEELHHRAITTPRGKDNKDHRRPRMDHLIKDKTVRKVVLNLVHSIIPINNHLPLPMALLVKGRAVLHPQEIIMHRDRGRMEEAPHNHNLQRQVMEFQTRTVSMDRIVSQMVVNWQ